MALPQASNTYEVYRVAGYGQTVTVAGIGSVQFNEEHFDEPIATQGGIIFKSAALLVGDSRQVYGLWRRGARRATTFAPSVSIALRSAWQRRARLHRSAGSGSRTW